MTLTELFNPSFFMLLGILLLALSFLIFYFENKAREQNHKINSMFSLVSSITEELNNANMRIHYLIQGNQSGLSNLNSNIHSVSIPSNTYSNENKIEVSDGEDEDEDDEDDEDEDDEEDDEDEDEDDADEDDDEDEDDIDDDKTYYQGTSNKEKPVIPTLEELSDLDEDDSMNGLEEQEEEEDKKETRTLTIHNENKESLEEQIKSIHISLDKINEPVDYKKLSVQQLKNLVVQKGLVAFEEANRMKKGELHKLLGELSV